VTEGTSYQIDLGVAGAAGVNAAASSVDNLTRGLAAAASASAAASDAVKAGETAYRQSEASADRAAKALEKITLAMAGASGTTLQNLVARQGEAAAKLNAATTAMNAAAGAAENEAKLSKSLDAAKTAAASVEKARAAAAGSGKVNEMGEAFAKLGGPLGAVGQKAFSAADGMKKLGSSLGSAGPYAAMAIAIVAITTAAIGATVAVGAWAVSLADAGRTSELLSDGIAGTVEGGRQLDKTIHNLSSVVPQTREELLSMAAGLAKTGLSGDALADALETAAVKAAKLKYGPDFQKQTLSISNQVTRLKANVAGVFGGLKIEKLLEGMATLVALFDSSTASGNAMKVVFEDFFQPLIDGVASLAPKAERLFLQLEIWAMKALIAVKPYGSTILLVAETFGVLAAVAVGTVGAVIAILGGVIAAAALVGIGVQILVNKLVAAGIAIYTEFKAPIDAVVSFLTSLSLAAIGSSLIDGLVAGIVGAGPGVIKAVTGIAGDAIGAAKKALGIASPSKVFAEIGMHTAAGMAEGVDGGSSDVRGSLEALVAPPAPAKSAPAPAAAAATARGTSDGGSPVFNFYGVEGAEDAQSRFEAAYLRMREGDAAQLGTAAPRA
jgi:hypothetical protein